MDFTFSDEQLSFRDSISTFLRENVTPDAVRARWESSSGLDSAFWAQLAELGMTAMLVPEEHGGLGLGPLDFIMLAQECGRVAVPEPIVVNALTAVPLMADVLAKGACGHEQEVANWLQASASGESLVLVGHLINPVINFAREADALLLSHGDEVHLVSPDDVDFCDRRSLDPSRRVASVKWRQEKGICIARGREGAEMWRSTLNRGALGAAAQLLGLAEEMVRLAVAYSTDREQFGRPIGSNQAVKHLLADCAVRIEYAKPVLHRAAYTVQAAPLRADPAVSHAKVACAEAASLAARNCIQTFGAMGYTWECDLQIFAKRAWVLEKNWGDSGFHKNRIHEWLLNPRALIGAEYTFGSRAAGHGSQSLAPPALEIVS